MVSGNNALGKGEIDNDLIPFVDCQIPEVELGLRCLWSFVVMLLSSNMSVSIYENTMCRSKNISLTSRWKMQIYSNLIEIAARAAQSVYLGYQRNSLRPNDGLSPIRRQAIIWTNAGILLIWPLGTNFSEIFIEIYAVPSY